MPPPDLWAFGMMPGVNPTTALSGLNFWGVHENNMLNACVVVKPDMEKE
jgi:hypothetical protein